MKIPKYWAKETIENHDHEGKKYMFSAWKWSYTSIDEARDAAKKAVKKISDRIINSSSSNRFEELERYAYSDRPLREEILDEVSDQEEAQIAVITRNAYGSLVLNTSGAMFIDIDFKGTNEPGFFASLIALFTGNKPITQEEKVLGQIQETVDRKSGWSMRVYRTFKGIRCLVTHKTFKPDTSETKNILKEFNSDDLYIKLCSAQECFRARLTPKPWRCNTDKPPARYPFEGTIEEKNHNDWVRKYDETIKNFATCRYVSTIGGQKILPEIKEIIDIHDRFTGCDSGLELA